MAVQAPPPTNEVSSVPRPTSNESAPPDVLKPMDDPVLPVTTPAGDEPSKKKGSHPKGASRK